jgi:hypothetical protein
MKNESAKVEDAAQQRGYRFLISWLESLAVAAHPLQPDSFVAPVAVVLESLLSLKRDD